MPKNFVSALGRSSRAASTFDGTYLPINTSGLLHPCFLIRIINDTSEDVDISYDGVASHDFIGAGETLQLNFQSNSSPANKQALFLQGSIVYVSAAAGTGTIYLVGYYQP